MWRNPFDRTRIKPRPASSCPATSVTPKRYRREGAPVANAPGWYIVRRKPPISMRLDHLLRRRPRFGPAAGAAAAGAVGLVLVLSLVYAHRGEAPPEQSRAILMPQATDSPGAGPGGPPAALAEPPAAGPTLKPDALIEEPDGRQDTSATVAPRAKADPAPSQGSMSSRETSVSLTPEWQSRPRSLAGMPSAARPQPSMGGTPSPTPASRAEALQPSRSSPQAAGGSATPGSAAKPQVASEVSSLEDRRALPTGEIRIFIHHVAGHQEDVVLAQQLADHLRRQGFTVADIRPVDFSIRKPSVRYFFDDDRSASERLVDELGRFFEEAALGTPDHASDFTHFVPKPRPGNVEVWLPAL
jgi:hypothetical protein